MHEIETKILEVDARGIVEKMLSLGAEKVQDTRLTVDWYGPAGVAPDKQPWYLRVRKTSEGKAEISWKSLATVVGNTRQSKEINFNVSDFTAANDFLVAVGLEHYAHQEKDRISWKYRDWNFDLDTYPGMPPYLEIEGTSESHVAEAIVLLDLHNHRAISEGERILIADEYHLNWFDMRF